MFRWALLVLNLCAVVSSAQVQALGDVAFSVPDAWKHQPRAGIAGMVLTADKNVCVIAVYAPPPSSGDSTAHVKEGLDADRPGWQRRSRYAAVYFSSWPGWLLCSDFAGRKPAGYGQDRPQCTATDGPRPLAKK